MRMIRRFGLGVVVLGMSFSVGAEKPDRLASTEEKLTYLLSSWRGKSLDDVHKVWGREKDVEQRNGNRVLVYEHRVKVRVNPFGFSVAPGAAGAVQCAVRFEIDADDKVIRAARRGGAPECWDAYKRNEP
jgi:hypothetical protein